MLTAAACGALIILAPAAGASARQTQAPGLSETRALCRESIVLSGVEADMDARIRAAVGDVREKLESVVPTDDPALQIYNEALELSLQDAKDPILGQLLESCIGNFTEDELRAINAFYASDAGQAWLLKGQTVIMPALERAVLDARPRIREDIERRYCARLGC